LGAAIAFDMDFPSFLLQAGRRPSDLMVVPENEYPEIDPMHSRMFLYRESKVSICCCTPVKASRWLVTIRDASMA